MLLNTTKRGRLRRRAADTSKTGGGERLKGRAGLPQQPAAQRAFAASRGALGGWGEETKGRGAGGISLQRGGGRHRCAPWHQKEGVGRRELPAAAVQCGCNEKGRRAWQACANICNAKGGSGRPEECVVSSNALLCWLWERRLPYRRLVCLNGERGDDGYVCYAPQGDAVGAGKARDRLTG